MLIINFLHKYQPSPILIEIKGIQIYWYGFFIVLGILAGYYVVLKLLSKKKSGIIEFVPDLFFYLIIVGIIGARIYHIFSELPYYLANPLDMIKIWNGGMGIFGAIVFGLGTIFLFAKKYKFSFLKALDVMSIGLILGQAIGRWGNYFNSELFGLPTKLAWGIPIIPSLRPDNWASFEYFHPCFLYESLWNFIIFSILLFLFLRFDKHNGRIFAVYLILYCLGRFLFEFLRVDFQPIFLGLRLAQITSIVGFLAGLLILKMPKILPK